MADEGKSHRTQITVALIGLVGVLGAALIANWDTVFPPELPAEDPLASNEPVERPSPEPEGRDEARPTQLTLAEAQREAEKITARWVEAWQAGDVETLVELSSPPFFLDNEILISPSDVRAKYQPAAQEGGKRFSIDRMMSGSIEEYQRLGYVKTNDRLLSRVQLAPDDLVVILIVSTETLSEEGIGFYFRRLGNRVEMAGFWD